MADFITLTLRGATYLDDIDDDDTIVIEVVDGFGLDASWLREAVRELAQPEPYEYTEQLTETSWGFEAESLEVVLTIAQHAWAGIVGGAAWDLARAVARSVRGSTDVAVRSDAEAQEAARIRVATRYDVNADDLKVTETTMDGGEAVVHMRAPDGVTYRVTLRADGSVVLTRVERL